MRPALAGHHAHGLVWYHPITPRMTASTASAKAVVVGHVIEQGVHLNSFRRIRDPREHYCATLTNNGSVSALAFSTKSICPLYCRLHKGFLKRLPMAGRRRALIACLEHITCWLALRTLQAISSSNISFAVSPPRTVEPVQPNGCWAMRHSNPSSLNGIGLMLVLHPRPSACRRQRRSGFNAKDWVRR
jgi:hypothetical protein